jgi:hypothetical protein
MRVAKVAYIGINESLHAKKTLPVIMFEETEIQTDSFSALFQRN